jgi:hypothetical protein
MGNPQPPLSSQFSSERSRSSDAQVAIDFTVPGGTLTLNAGWHRIPMEFYDNVYDAVAKLSWAGPGLARQIIPAANLRQSS